VVDALQHQSLLLFRLGLLQVDGDRLVGRASDVHDAPGDPFDVFRREANESSGHPVEVG
jgi:hypothetical protein